MTLVPRAVDLRVDEIRVLGFDTNLHSPGRRSTVSQCCAGIAAVIYPDAVLGVNLVIADVDSGRDFELGSNFDFDARALVLSEASTQLVGCGLPA
jgi:hypothetical protein